MQSNYLHLMMLAVATLWDASVDGAPASQKLCGRKLGEIMSRVCHAYNSPAWDVPTVVEHPSARRKRHAGIADECCTVGCTWKQLSSYCAISANSESPLEDLESHMIEDRSAERASESTMMLMRSRPVEDLLKSVVRAAPVVGTVSPLLTWGRTINTDLPPAERDRYAYIVYA